MAEPNRLTPELLAGMTNDGAVVPDRLSPGLAEVVDRFTPLLRRAPLADHPEAFKRYKEYVPAALAKLVHAWEGLPSSDDDATLHIWKGRAMEFEEFVRIQLGWEVRHLDEEQNPDFYDPHRRYIGHIDFEGPPPPVLVAELDDELLEKHEKQLADGSPPVPANEPDGQIAERLVRAMDAHNIPRASQAMVLRAIAGVAAGSVANGRQTSKAFGLQQYAASILLIEAHEFLAEVGVEEHKPFGYLDAL